MSRGRRALELHGVEEWQALAAKAKAKAEVVAETYGAGSREHNAAAYELRRAEQWRDEAVEEHQRQHRYDDLPDDEVARRVADRIRSPY